VSIQLLPQHVTPVSAPQSFITPPVVVVPPPVPVAAKELDAHSAFLLNLLNSKTTSAEVLTPDITLESLQLLNAKSSVKQSSEQSKLFSVSVAPPGLDRTPSDDGYGKKLFELPTGSSSKSSQVVPERGTKTTNDKYFKSKSGFSVRL
jgi:hypothetical protein